MTQKMSSKSPLNGSLSLRTAPSHGKAPVLSLPPPRPPPKPCQLQFSLAVHLSFPAPSKGPARVWHVAAIYTHRACYHLLLGLWSEAGWGWGLADKAGQPSTERSLRSALGTGASGVWAEHRRLGLFCSRIGGGSADLPLLRVGQLPAGLRNRLPGRRAELQPSEGFKRSLCLSFLKKKKGIGKALKLYS